MNILWLHVPRGPLLDSEGVECGSLGIAIETKCIWIWLAGVFGTGFVKMVLQLRLRQDTPRQVGRSGLFECNN